MRIGRMKRIDLRSQLSHNWKERVEQGSPSRSLLFDFPLSPPPSYPSPYLFEADTKKLTCYHQAIDGNTWKIHLLVPQLVLWYRYIDPLVIPPRNFENTISRYESIILMKSIMSETTWTKYWTIQTTITMTIIR